MKPFEFVLIIVSVIIGLALTEFALGVADMIKMHRTANYYWAHMVLGVYGFMSCLNYWGSVYRLKRLKAWTVPQMGIVFLTGMFFYAMTHLVFPSSQNFDYDYKRYFHENIAVIFILMIGFVVFFILESLLVRRSRKFRSYLVGLGFIATIATGLIIANETYRAVLTAILGLMQVYNMYANRVIIYDAEGASSD